MEAVSLFLLFLLVGSFSHTAQTAYVQRLFASLLGQFSVERKQLADALNLNEAQLSRQLNPYEGRGPGLYTLPVLPVPLVRELVKRLAALYGLTCLDSDDFRDVLLEAVYQQKKRMAVVELEHRKEGAA